MISVDPQISNGVNDKRSHVVDGSCQPQTMEVLRPPPGSVLVYVSLNGLEKNRGKAQNNTKKRITDKVSAVIPFLSHGFMARLSRTY